MKITKFKGSDNQPTVVINLSERRSKSHSFNPERFIAKCQRPLYTTHASVDDPIVLIYSAGHEILYNHPLTDEIRQMFGKQFKIFVWASLSEKGELSLNEPAPWQEW